MTVTKIPTVTSDKVRKVTDAADLLMRNRYVERNDALNDQEISFVARPGIRFITNPGSGPIRGILSRGNDSTLRVVTGNSLYSILLLTGATSSIFSGFGGSSTNAPMSFCTTGELGTNEARDWFADNENGLFMFTFNSFASATLTASGTISATETVVIDGIYYEFTGGSVDTGAPDGSSADPWLVATGGTVATALENLRAAINTDGTAGSQYSSATEEHPTVFTLSTETTATTVKIRAKTEGNPGEGLVTSETGANLSWSGNTANGGESEVIEIPLPSTLVAKSVASFNGYVVVVPGLPQVPAGADKTAGRFYWVRPGEVLIDPLDFATAEREADILQDVQVFNDQLWLMGERTTEIWYATGDQDEPFARMQGVIFDRGVKFGTPKRVKGGVAVIDHDCSVFLIAGQEKKMSTPDIEERIRKAFLAQKYNDTNYVHTWVFTLDGHECYVIQLQSETLVFDFYSEQWYCWGTGDNPKWNIQTGITVTSENLFRLFEAFPSLTAPTLSSTIVGDSTNGALYVLDNQYPFDDDNAGITGNTFDRLIFGQLIQRGSDFARCAGVEVVGSQGKPFYGENLLDDPSALNLSSWTKTELPATANGDTSPDGTASADVLKPSTNSASHFVYQDITLEETGANVLTEVSLKSNGYDYAILHVGNTAGTSGFQMNVNLATGEVLSSPDVGLGTTVDAQVDQLLDDWYHLRLVGNVSGTGTYRCTIYVYNSSAFSVFAGDGTSGISAWNFTAREAVEAPNVTLYYSDDGGNTFANAGSIELLSGRFNQRLDWRSLGTIREPGRIFKLRDTGALRRFDGMNMRDSN